MRGLQFKYFQVEVIGEHAIMVSGIVKDDTIIGEHMFTCQGNNALFLPLTSSCRSVNIFIEVRKFFAVQKAAKTL